MTKFHGNILSLSENIAKTYKGGYFFDSHCSFSQKWKTGTGRYFTDIILLPSTTL